MMQLRPYKLLFFSSLLAFVACGEDQELDQGTTSEDEKTPLTVTALLDVDTRASQTRATDTEFETDDRIVAYLRHVTWNGETTGDRQVVTVDQSPLLVTFTKGASPMIAYAGEDIIPIGTGVALGMHSGNTMETTDLVSDPLVYWDDFSDSGSTTTDLRTEGHYMQSYYGYCYNGGTPSESLTNETGVLGWTIQADQSAEVDYKHSDLLWSAEQTPVGYAHKDSNNDTNRRGLILPFTHAMSKVTINVTAGDGYADNFAFTGTELTLKEVRTQCTATAPTATLEYATTGISDVKMYAAGKNKEVAKTYTFQAIIVPSVLSLQNTLATITNMEGNNYVIPVTPAIFDGWKTQLDDVDENVHHGTAQAPTRADIPQGVGHQMRSGVNYVLNVTVHKTKISVTAAILDWNQVTAEGEGKIVFDADVVNSVLNSHPDDITEGSFDLWRAKTIDALSGVPTSVYSLTDGSWKGSPTLYWMDDDSYYFRALAKPTNADATKIESVEGKTAASQGLDLLWATTPEHTGDDDAKTHYEEGGAINPRSGNVPLVFNHAMSKVSLSLQTISGEGGVNLAGAEISFINLYDQGKIDVKDGLIKDLQSPSDPINLKHTVDSKYELNDLLFIPQSLVNFANGNERDLMAKFYNSADLAKIYSDGTSIDNGGAFHTYLISDLIFVDAVKFTDADATAMAEHNARLDGAVATGSPKSFYTEDEAENHNKEMLGDNYKKAGYIKEAARLYTLEEYNALHPDRPVDQSVFENLSNEDKTKPAVLYTAEDALAYNKAQPGFVEEGNVKETYDADGAAAYNATLPGAWHVGDVKTPAHYKLKDPSNLPTEHFTGELSEPGNKILLFIKLANGMLYKAELKDFQLSDGTRIEEWEPGKHYHYTITLAKDQILFRAYIRKWDEVEASGMITPEW